MLEWAQVRVSAVVLELELHSVWESLSELELMGLSQPVVPETWA
jgi:hypothetical protein